MMTWSVDWLIRHHHLETLIFIGEGGGSSLIVGSDTTGENHVMDPAAPTRPDAAPDPKGPVTRAGAKLALWLVLLATVAVTLLFWDVLVQWWERLSYVFGSPAEFRSWVEGFGAWGPVAYVLALAAQVIVVPVPGTLFPPVGALAFGAWPAFALSLAGLALGSALVFLIARRWGRPVALRLAGEDRIARYEAVIAARGGLLLWLVFLLPLLPDDAVCAMAGVSAISFRRFLVIATVGRIPAVAVGVFGMAGLEGAPGWVWAAAAVGLGLMVWVGVRFGPTLEQRLVGRLTRNDRVTADD
jgi:uncharacterized membrane protein YdjX (TVP38/TMEM64 family)